MELLKKYFDTALESPDGVKKLRQLILSLAMQGKLVKQDPNDQPASELLKEIQAEKEKVSREGAKSRRKKNELLSLKPEEVPYEVPEGWAWCRFNEINVVKSELVISKDFPDEKQIGPDSIEKDRGRLLFTRTVSEFGSIGPNSKFYKGQLLYSKIRPSLNKAVIAPYNGLCSADMYPIETSINIEFMLRMILSEVFLSQVRREENRVKMPKLNLESLYAFLVPLPPLAEQKRIVAKIDQLMTLCDTLEKQRAERNKKRRTVHVSTLHHLLNASDKREFDNSWRFIRSHFDELYSVKENVVELKKAILSLAMQGKLVKQDPNDQPASELLKEIQAERERLVAEGKIKSQKPLPPITPEEVPYQVPSGWEWVRLCTIGEINPRNEYDDNEIAGFVPMPMIFSEYGKNHTFEARKWNEIKKGYTHFANGDIGLAKITPCFENGKSCIFNGLPNSVGAGTTELHIFRNTYNAIIPEYLLAYLKNPYYIRLGIKKMTGSAGQKRVPTDYFSFNPFPLPPLAEQKRIVAKIDQLMALCDTLERQICDATGKQTALLNAVVEKAKITHTKIYAIK